MVNIDTRNCRLWDLTQEEVLIMGKANMIALRENQKLKEWFKEYPEFKVFDRIKKGE